jgi:hypothetical protein
MKIKLSFITIVTILSGAVVLLGYFIQAEAMANVQLAMLEWAVILAATAALVGIISLLGVHFRKFFKKGKRDIYSPILILSCLGTFIYGLYLGPSSTSYQYIVTSIQKPVETSLLALLAVSLALVSLQLLRRRKDLMAIIFVLAVIVFLFEYSGFLTTIRSPLVSYIVSALNRLPLAGARGILIGIALGSLLTGIRIMIGSERPLGK